MRKEKFVYNRHTLRYEKVEESLSTRILRIFGFVCAAIFTAFIFTLILHEYFPSPKEKALLQEIDAMEAEYDKLNADFEVVQGVLDNLKDRDAYAYRMIFGMNPIDEDVWEGGVGGHDEYENLREYRHGGEVMAQSWERVRKLRHQLALQSKSLDTLMNMATEKEKMLASMPSIKPVRSDKLVRGVRLLSGFGYRIHPIFKVKKMHYGIDFTAPRGTAIQATGDGVIKKATISSSFGNYVVIDHGYGYETLYAHMSAIHVKVGEKVKRGQQIGLVGNTGRSTAPHCHYEVHFKGQPVDPIDYVRDGLSPEEYQKIVEAASMVNQSLD